MTTSVDALSQSIVVIGLNAALQKRFILPPSTNLQPGNVHRAHKVETGVGGKGQDVGVALSCLMSKDPKENQLTTPDEKVLLAQFLGQGPEGDSVSNTLKTQHNLSDLLTIRNAAPLRTCTTIVGETEATELVETSGSVTPTEMKALQSKIDILTKSGGKANCVCIMGSMPPGCPDDTYADLTKRLAGKESLVLIDSVIGLDPLLSVLKSIYDGDDDNDKQKKGGAVLKLNAAELCKLANVPKSSGETHQITTDELISSTRGFISEYKNAIGALSYLCITDGKFPGHLVKIPQQSSSSELTDFQMWELPAVDLGNVGMLYPIGAGDTVAAGTLAAWQYLHHNDESTSSSSSGVIPPKVGSFISKKKTEWSSSSSEEENEGNNMATAFAFGLACGSASCMQEENSVFSVDDAERFFVDMAKPIIQ